MNRTTMSPNKPVRPLSMTIPGECVRLVDVRGGRGIRQRLSAMGLLPGTEITVVSNNISGPMTIAVKETRFILGRGMVHRVMVA